MRIPGHASHASKADDWSIATATRTVQAPVGSRDIPRPRHRDSGGTTQRQSRLPRESLGSKQDLRVRAPTRERGTASSRGRGIAPRQPRRRSSSPLGRSQARRGRAPASAVPQAVSLAKAPRASPQMVRRFIGPAARHAPRLVTGSAAVKVRERLRFSAGATLLHPFGIGSVADVANAVTNLVQIVQVSDKSSDSPGDVVANRADLVCGAPLRIGKIPLDVALAR